MNRPEKELQFERAIQDHPLNRDIIDAYADYLEEQGDERAYFLRVNKFCTICLRAHPVWEAIQVWKDGKWLCALCNRRIVLKDRAIVDMRWMFYDGSYIDFTATIGEVTVHPPSFMREDAPNPIRENAPWRLPIVEQEGSFDIRFHVRNSDPVSYTAPYKPFDIDLSQSLFQGEWPHEG